jgi:hypothetical protein
MQAIGRDVVVAGLGAFGSAAPWRLHGIRHRPGTGELLAHIVAGRPLYAAADFLDPARFS